MATGNAVWNLTVPDTSLMFDYDDFNRDCPLNNGVLQCTTGSSHVSNATQSSISLRFFGTAVYLFGTVDGGTQYTVQLDNGKAIPGTVQPGNLIASYTNLPNSQEGGTLHQVTLSATRFKDGSILRFTGAIISVDTGSAHATTSITKYSLLETSDSVVLTPGWSKNGSYLQSGESFAQQATVNFEGSGVMVYGLCSNTRQDFGNDYGEATADVDTFPHDVGDSSDGGIFQTRPYIADDCLMYFSAFAQGVHNLTYDSNRDNVFLSRFEVLSLDGSGGGTGSSNSQGGVSTPTGSGGSSGGSSAGSGGSSLGAGNSTVGLGDGTDSVAKALGISIGAIVGIVVTVIGVVVLACIACCLVCRRRRRATAVYINNAGGPSMTQQNAKQETPSASQTALPVQSYAAPSLPPPAPFQMQAQTQPGGTYAPPTGPPPAAARKPVPPARTLSMASRSSAWSSHGSQATERPRAVSNAHGPPQPYAISTTVPTAPSTVSPSSTTPDGSHEDPYAGMASYHPDPFAFAGRGMVLSADGVYTYDDPAALNKMRNERAGARVNRVGESSGSTSMPPAASGSAGVESAQEDAPPPVYEETQAPTRV